MTHPIVRVFSAPMMPSTPGAAVVERFLQNRKSSTQRSYRKDLERFRTYLDAQTAGEAATELLRRAPGDANDLVLQYQDSLRAEGLAPATINRRIGTLRSLVKLARVLGHVTWNLEVENVRGEAYRDTRGPGRAGYRAMLEVLSHKEPRPLVLRDRALIRLAYDLALRRSEIVSLDLIDVDLGESRIQVLSKGRYQKQTLTLPAPTRAALAAWMEARGREPGALFINFDRAKKGGGGKAWAQPLRRLTATRPCMQTMRWRRSTSPNVSADEETAVGYRP